MDQLSADDREVIVSTTACSNATATRAIDFKLSRTTFRADLTLGPAALDAGINGLVVNMVRAFGKTDPQFTPATTTIDGHPARRVDYVEAMPSGLEIYAHGLVIQDGQMIWTILAIVTEKSFDADAKRIIDSVGIAGAAAAPGEPTAGASEPEA